MGLFSKIGKWKIGRALKAIVVAAGPVAGGLIAGPGGVAVATAALGLAGLTKKAGQKNEEKGGKPFHKVASPLVAIATTAAGAHFLPPETMARICEIGQTVIELVCANKALAGAGLGALLVGLHQTGSNVDKATGR